MTDLLSYERDPYCTVIETLVLRVDEEDGRPYAVLADTILYPEGGGFRYHKVANLPKAPPPKGQQNLFDEGDGK
jgi:hypothetical protein